MDQAEMRDSLREIGALLPVIQCGGQEIDGRQRRKISLEVGRKPVVLELDQAQALRALWLLHPERAIERAGKCTLDEYARAFGTRPLRVAQFLQSQQLSAPIVSPADLDGKAGNGRHVQMWWSPRLHFLASTAAQQRGLNLSAFVREAVATHIARTLGTEAPTIERGAHSGPRKPRTVTGVEHRARQDTRDGRTREARASTR